MIILLLNNIDKKGNGNSVKDYTFYIANLEGYRLPILSFNSLEVRVDNHRETNPLPVLRNCKSENSSFSCCSCVSCCLSFRHCFATGRGQQVLFPDFRYVDPKLSLDIYHWCLLVFTWILVLTIWLQFCSYKDTFVYGGIFLDFLKKSVTILNWLDNECCLSFSKSCSKFCCDNWPELLQISGPEQVNFYASFGFFL